MNEHNYCAFCGGVAAHINGDRYRPHVVSEASLEWLGQVRLLLEAHVQSGTYKYVFDLLLIPRVLLTGNTRGIISRRPMYFEQGYYMFDKPTAEEMAIGPNWWYDELSALVTFAYLSICECILPDTDQIFSYGDCGPEDICIPVHEACLELFRKYHLPDDLDADALFLAIKPLCGKNKLRIDYGRITSCQGRKWRERRGQESFVTIPTTLPDLLSTLR